MFERDHPAFRKRLIDGSLCIIRHSGSWFMRARARSRS